MKSPTPASAWYSRFHDPPYLRKARAAARRVDYAGIFLIVSTLGLLQMVLDHGQRADWFASPWVTYATAGRPYRWSYWCAAS